MSEFLEGLGQQVSDVVSDLREKAENAVEIQRKKSQIGLLNRANDRDIRDIGRMIYEKFKNGELMDTEYIALCEAIEKREEEIAHQKEAIARIKEGN